MIDIAKEILDNVQADPRQKALALHAFHVAPHEHALAQMIQHLNIPRDVKADLWDAKRNSVNDPKITKLYQLSHLPADVLDRAESHPNTMKLLMDEGKEKGEPKAAQPKAAPKAKEMGSPAPGMAKEKDVLPPAGHPSELPPGHTHIQSSDGAELYIPSEHLHDAQAMDPGLKILNQG